MALTTVIRRDSSTLTTIAFRAARSPVRFRSGGTAAAVVNRSILGNNNNNQLTRGVSIISSFTRRFSTENKTTADEKLVSVLESEIECAVTEEAPDTNVKRRRRTLSPPRFSLFGSF